jgi:glycosyltransferase involved in cell wall biosynthesis
MMKATWDAGRQGPVDFIVRNPKAVQAVERYCIPRLDRIIVTVAEAGARIVALGADSSRISIVHNSPPAGNADRRRSEQRGPEGDVVRVVYLGILELPRGIGELLDAIAMLRKSGKNFVLTIIGGGRDEVILRERAAALSLDETAANFAGFVPHEQAIRMVADADIGVNPLHDSPVFQTCIPNKLFDYMAAGLPVISSDMQACARLLRETGAGEVFRAGDAADLAAALERMGDAVTRRRIGEQGRNAVRTKYNWEEDSRVLLETVERAVSS